MVQFEVNGASFVARCRILKVLLRSPQVGDCGRHVSSVADSLCSSWWDGANKNGQGSKKTSVLKCEANST